MRSIKIAVEGNILNFLNIILSGDLCIFHVCIMLHQQKKDLQVTWQEQDQTSIFLVTQTN